MGIGEFNAGGNPAMDYRPIQRGVEIPLVASCHKNRDKLRPDGPRLARMQTLATLINWALQVHVAKNNSILGDRSIA